ncbi:hypothetical protein CPB85DRAFT_1378657 [Mucidula mucida]|nr:hypothetical protein CPB85DRAFT_1378657 [Mucidula mucida]
MPRTPTVSTTSIRRTSCPYPGCLKTFKPGNTSGLTRHVKAIHHKIQQPPSNPTPASPPPASNDSDDQEMRHDFTPPSPQDEGPERQPTPEPELPRHHKTFHPHLTGTPCDENGHDLPNGTPPPPPPPPINAQNPWAPFADQVAFRMANLLFKQMEASKADIDEIMECWSLSLMGTDRTGPFSDHDHLFNSIDAIPFGSAPWKCFQTADDPTLPPTAPSWMKERYQIWYRDPDVVIANMLSNPDFAGEFDTRPYVHLGADGKRRWSEFMSGNYSWNHATKIYQDDPTTKGAMYVPIIVGSDKTTVSVMTGNVEYHPLYAMIGNIHGGARRAHRNGVIPIGFLAIPKADRQYDGDVAYRNFKRQLYHESIASILRPLKPAMEVPVVRRCPDGHFRRVIYDLAAYIADYPEQVLLAGVVSGWCPKYVCSTVSIDCEYTEKLSDEFGGEGTRLWDNWGIDESVEMMASDLLHQLIKGTFKDHLVDWVGEYLELTEGSTRAKEIMDDIDCRIAASPQFPGLRRFPQGRRYKQWTGDDSKALMKVFLPAIAEYVEDDVVKCIAAFIDFCYLARKSDITEDTLVDMQAALTCFHTYRQVFIRAGVRENFNLPRQHAMKHYFDNIVAFGPPNGLCSSITESRHITAVKKPWRRQMLLINQRLDKLHALYADLVFRNLLPPSHAPRPEPFDGGDEDEGPVDDNRVLAEVVHAVTRKPLAMYSRDLYELAVDVDQPTLPELTRRFLYEQLHAGDVIPDNIDDCPHIDSNVYVHHSAIAYFYAPSDISGIHGMKREHIRSTPSWYGYPRRDCALVVEDADKPGFHGMSVVRILLFFSFTQSGVEYPCALVHWFNRYGARPDPKTGMWMVKPDNRGRDSREPYLSVVHLDSLFRGVQLLPVFGPDPLPKDFHYSDTLDAFDAFYVNKYVDYHAYEMIF